MSIPIVGRCFATVAEFLEYLDGVQFGAWRPRYVVMHHTGSPDLAIWRGWQTRPKPVTDEQWLRNLKGYYESLGWSRAPHFFFTPAHYCVLSMPNVRGTHAVSFNANSWGVECVGDFDRERLDGELRDRYVAGLAALHVAAGLAPSPYQRGTRGLHFHRDDPKTSKTCPGRNVLKDPMVEMIEAAMVRMTPGDHPEEHVEPSPTQAAQRRGVTNTPGDTLTVRADASARAPMVTTLPHGSQIVIVGEAMNGPTKWFAVEGGGWVAARYINEA